MVAVDKTAVAATTDAAAPGGVIKRRTFRTFQYRGVPLEKLMDLNMEQLMELYPARKRRKFLRKGHAKKYKTLIAKLSKAKVNCQLGEKPKTVKTHLRHCCIFPEMIGSVVGVYNGKKFIDVEIKAEMLGHYLGEFSLTYTPVKHGRAGAAGARYTPLK